MAYGIDFSVTNRWSSGFTGAIALRNANPTATNGWTVEFYAPFEITSIWNATIVSRAGGYYTIRNEAWNGGIAANGSVDFGFQANGAATPPTDVSVNGQDVGGDAPTLSISDTTLTEGNSGTKNATFTVTLSEASDETVTVNYGAANGTAAAGSDYTAKSGALTFAPGQTSASVTVAIRGDTQVEANESFTVNLSNPANATIAKAVGRGTITNDDAAAPTFQVADVTVTEGTGGARTALVTVTLSAPLANSVAVSYATSNGTATAGSDYAAGSGRLVFSPGQTSKTIAIPIATDAGFEPDETFRVTLSSPNGAAISRPQATVTIVNDDAAPPTLQVADVTVTEGTGGARTALVTVTLTAPAANTVAVSYATANGTATAGADYTAATGRLTFAPGQTSRTIAIPIATDAAVEANETFRVTLSSPNGAAVSRGQGTVTITNDDAPTPALRVADVSVVEGTGGARSAVLTVTLSAPASGAVAVSYATSGDTATAGVDFISTSGRLTFDPGETSKTISIPLATDALVEANETFKLTLSNPSGATVARAQATITITNDDAARPTISVADATVTEGNPVAVGGAGQGYFRTQGNDIVDAAGNDVKLAGVNWFGMESTRYTPDGLHTRNYKEMMDQMADLGFNAIRLPFSSQMLEAGSRPNGIDYGRNPDLQGLSGLQIMDKIVDYAGEIGMKIILDHHRPAAGNGASENGLWYDATYTEQRWIQTWTTLATRYAGDSTVIGADLHNEPHKGTWGGGGATDWAAAAERAGNAVLAANPNLLIFVEGVESYQNNYYWWGGNLMGVRDRPIELDIANRVVYSAHDYPNSIYPQPWFSDPNFANTLPAKFDQMWGYIERENIAPVFLGEFGSKLTDPKDLVWLDKITDYLAGDYDGDGTRDMPAGEQGVNWTWWSWNPNSGDTGGILMDDWTTVHENKVASLRPLMFEFGGPGSGGTRDGDTTMTFRVTLSAPSTTTVNVDYATAPGAAGAFDFTAVSGTLAFAPGETVKTVAVRVRGDGVAEPDEAFQFLLSTPRNATIGDGAATGRILNDDAAASAARMATASIAAVAVAGPEPEAQPLSATTTVTDAWGAGGVASVTLRNAGPTAVEDWTITLDTPLDITDIWNAEIERRDEDEYTISATGWNARLAPGQEITFGLQATGAVTADAFDWSF